MQLITQGLSRRRALIGAAAASLIASTRASAQSALLAPTPAQGPGPFFPEPLPADMDNDLVRITGDATRAIGTVIHIFGRVTDVRGAPVRDAVVEIYSTDASGKYLNPRQRLSRDRDPHFQGIGRCAVEARGDYRFRTIKPVAYIANNNPVNGFYRAAHVHYTVYVGEAKRLESEIYFHDDPLLRTDILFTRLTDDASRAAVTMELVAADDIEANTWKGRFNIILADA